MNSDHRHTTYFGTTTKAEVDVLEQLASQLGLQYVTVASPNGIQVQMKFPDLVLKGYVEDQVYAIRDQLKQLSRSVQLVSKERSCEAG
jgi:hypothetical protein